MKNVQSIEGKILALPDNNEHKKGIFTTFYDHYDRYLAEKSISHFLELQYYSHSIQTLLK
jgi:hypothetical protein